MTTTKRLDKFDVMEHLKVAGMHHIVDDRNGGSVITATITGKVDQWAQFLGTTQKDLSALKDEKRLHDAIWAALLHWEEGQTGTVVNIMEWSKFVEFVRKRLEGSGQPS